MLSETLYRTLANFADAPPSWRAEVLQLRAEGWNKPKEENVILLFATSVPPREKDSQFHRKWGLLMLGGRPKLYRLCLDNTNISNGGTKPYELQLAPHACPGNDVLFMCSRTCWGKDSNHLQRALGRRDCSSNRPSDPNHGQVRLRPDICR